MRVGGGLFGKERRGGMVGKESVEGRNSTGLEQIACTDEEDP